MTCRASAYSVGVYGLAGLLAVLKFASEMIITFVSI